MCNCEDVEIGTHDASVAVSIPHHMDDYRKARKKAGLSGMVTVDICLLPEIQSLWKRKVHTRGCCCGHNKKHPYICVAPRSTDKMRELGYEPIDNPHHDEQMTFKPKTVE